MISVVRSTAPAQNILVIDRVHQSSFDRQAWPEQWQIDGRADPKVRLSASGVLVDIKADGRFSVTMAEPEKLPPVVLRAEHPTRGIHFYVARPQDVATDKIPDVSTDKTVEPAKPASGCGNAELLMTHGSDAESSGDHQGALGLFEQSYKCKPEAHVVQLAFMSACNGNNLQKAREYWKKLAPRAQQLLKQIAFRANISEAELNAP